MTEAIPVQTPTPAPAVPQVSSFAGTVLGENNQPLAGAVAFLKCEGDRTFEQQTSPTGTFRFSSVPSTNCVLHVNGSYSREIQLRPGERLDLEVHLRKQTFSPDLALPEGADVVHLEAPTATDT